MAQVHMILERNAGVIGVHSSMKKAESKLAGIHDLHIKSGWVLGGTIICLGEGSYTRYTKGDKYRDYRIESYVVE